MREKVLVEEQFLHSHGKDQNREDIFKAYKFQFEIQPAKRWTMQLMVESSQTGFKTQWFQQDCAKDHAT
jgi:hypothetical protein